jgi:NAD(P)-dependent dehydrogenase (short-subunit alcohol dehydrogenase family)
MEGIKMKNKLAIVTGGTRGIGAEISIELKKWI